MQSGRSPKKRPRPGREDLPRKEPAREEKPREAAAIARQQFESSELLARLGLRWTGTAAILAGILFFWTWLFLDSANRGTILLGIMRPEDLIGQWLGHIGHAKPPLGFFDRAPIVLTALFILVASLGPGSLLVSWLTGKKVEDKLEHIVLALGAGLNLGSLLVLAGGMSTPGALREPWWIWLGLLIGLLLLPVAVWRLLGTADENVEQIPLTKDEKQSWLARWGWIFIALLSLPYLFGGVLLSWDFDVREYHLQAPKEWMQRGQIEFLPHNVYANMPLGAEMHAITATSILGAGDEAWWLGGLTGKLIVSLYAPLTALLLWSIGRRLGNVQVGLIAAVCYLTLPWVGHVAISGLNDAVLGFYLLACWWVWWRGEANWRALLLAGFFAGAGAAVKYPAAIFVVMPLVIETLLRKFRLRGGQAAQVSHLEKLRQAAIAMVLLLIGGLAGSGLWYAKNAMLTGNPVYPLLAKTLGGETRTPEKDARWVKAHAVPEDKAGRRFTVADVIQRASSFAIRSPLASPLLVPLALCGCLAVLQQWRSKSRQSQTIERFARLAVGLVAFNFVAWYLLTHRIDRFLVPALPLLALLAGFGYAWLKDNAGSAIARTFLAVGLLYSVLVLTGFAAVVDARWFVALKYLREDPVISNDPMDLALLRLTPAEHWLNERLTGDGGVLLVGGACVWDLNGKSQATNVYYNTCFDDCVLLNWRSGKKTVEEFREEFTKRNVKYLCVDWNELRRYMSEGNYGYDRRFSAKDSLSLFNNFEHTRLLKQEISFGEEREFLGFAPRPSQVIYRVLTAAEAASEAAAERRQKAATKNIKPTPQAEPPKSANQSSTSE